MIGIRGLFGMFAIVAMLSGCVETTGRWVQPGNAWQLEPRGDPVARPSPKSWYHLNRNNEMQQSGRLILPFKLA